MSAYAGELLKLWPDHLVQIDRRDAPSIRGAVQEIGKEGVSVMEVGDDDLKKEGEAVFIAYIDIRGVRGAGWDYDVIS